nr:MAG TPA: hypothetical protein [Herelleviridae sp.]
MNTLTSLVSLRLAPAPGECLLLLFPLFRKFSRI